MKFPFVFFDLDGTISDTEPDIRAAWRRTIAAMGVPCPEFDSVFRVGPALPEAAKSLFPEVAPEVRGKIMTAYKSFYDDADSYTALPYPGMVDAIKKLAASGRKIFVVTNKRLKPTDKLMRKFDLFSALCGIITPDIVSPEYQLSKADMIKLAMRISGVGADPGAVLMVGDTEIDITAGKVNRTSTCGVRWGYAQPGKLENSAPDFLVNNADEFLTLF